MDMPFAFDDKLAFNLPEGYRGVWESDERKKMMTMMTLNRLNGKSRSVRLFFLIMNAVSRNISFRAASIILNGMFPIIRMM